MSNKGIQGLGAGLGQMVSAGQLVYRKAMGARVRGRARTRSARLTRRMYQTRGKSADKPKAKFKRRRLSNNAGGPRRGRYSAMKPARMVKGSAAAKRHMAKLRRMRKRR